MAKSNFDQCLALVLKHEGGYVNHPADPGGRTNLGVTQKVWEAYVGHPVTEADMRALTPADVAPMYKTKYWDVVKGDDLPRGVDYAVFDLAVNSGTGRAAKTLQAALGVTSDGQIGPATLAACKAADPIALAESVCDARLAFLQGLATFATFGKGWSRRVAETRAMAQTMAADRQMELPL
jgi:lysozyme family protein